MSEKIRKSYERHDREANQERVVKADFKFEKSGEDSPWTNQFFLLWVGAKKSFEF